MNNFLLVGDKFMPEMPEIQPGFTYSAFANLPKLKKELKSLCKLEVQILFIKNELDKACFQHDMTYGKIKNLVKRTQSDKVLKDKAFTIAGDPNYDCYQRGLASMVYKFLIRNLVEVAWLMKQVIN